MKTQLLDAQNPKTLSLAVDYLQRGAVIALPTDTLYGVGALAFNADAVAEIYRVKDRPADKPIPVFVDSINALAQVCQSVPPAALPLLEEFWPGGLTVVLPASETLPSVVAHSGTTVAVRIPNHPVTLTLLAKLKQPLAVTSANISAQETPPDAPGVLAQLDGRLPLILDDGPSPIGVASTILDLTQSPARILRQGAVQIPADFLNAF